ncbi:MAG: LysM peptidoglycan-binding domain-containing protein [Deltaproteobacteria bacterium]|nr:LysM peptidoglycan-binding domain-containing protein [Deltaproteobacteria bacterium]
MLGESVQFDPALSRSSFSDQPVAPGGVARALRQSAESCGLDAVAELYNEALRFATEGHYLRARERLLILLALAPEDGEARLLLAKVLVAGQRWREALAALDEASSYGQSFPGELRTAVEEHLRADQAAEEEQRAARVAREQGEIKALRQEARRLRSENAQLVARNRELEKETRKWAWTTAAVSAVAILFVLVNLLFGGSAGPSATEVAAAMNRHAGQSDAPALVAAAGETLSEVVPVPVEPVVEASVGARAAGALRAVPGMQQTGISFEVLGTTAVLGGNVQRYRELQEAKKALLAVSGIDNVEISGVEIRARTEGGTHTVGKGDTLSHLAYEYYGECSKADRILQANKRVLKGRPNLQIGQELLIPAVE